jgi:hypothetical protein
MSNILIAMLLSHFAGDFYLQTKQSVENKFNSYWWTLLHGVIYLIPGILILLLYAPKNFFGFFMVFALSHLIYDSIKFLTMSSKKKPSADQGEDDEVLLIDWVFFADQAAHILTIIIICIVYLNLHGDISVLSKIIACFNTDAVMFDKIMRAILILVIILQPVSIAFGKLFNIEKLSELKTQNVHGKDAINGSGRVIGYLERLIIITGTVKNYAQKGMRP